MAKLFTLILALLCFSICNCAATKLNLARIPKVNVSSTLTLEFDGKGLEPWYDVAKSFIHTVQKDDVPYDELHKIKDGGFEPEEFLKGWELPFLVVFAIGVLFAIIVPIVGFCFCCCRCCGNCGGEMVQKPSSKSSCKRATFGAVLGIITLLMFVGCLLAFVSNDRITDTVESYKTTPIRAIRDAEQYFNNTVNVVTDSLIDGVLKVLDVIVNDVEDIPSNIANDIKAALSDSVQKPLDSVVKLGEETKSMEELLQQINSTTKTLQLKFKNLTENIQKVKNDLNTSCNSPSGCNGVDPGSLTTVADFSNLPDVQKELTNIQEINSNNFSSNAQKGRDEFDNLNKTIKDETGNATSEITDSTKDAKKQFEDIKKDIKDKVVEQILSKTDNWVADIDEWFEDGIKPYDKYRYYAGVGLTCLVLIPVVLMAVGLLCGIFGHDKHAGPTERGAISNMGGNCLMAAVGFMFIFVFFLMIFAAFCFILGAHLEKGCYSVREETIYDDFIDVPKYWDDKYILADAFYNNGSTKLTVKHVLQECRKNAALYKAIQGENKWNLNDEFSVKDKLGDIESNLDDFEVPLEDREILNDETEKGLRDLTNSSVDDIEFEKFFNETRKDVVNNTLIDQMRLNLDNSSNAALIKISEDLKEIQLQAQEMKNLSDSLERNVKKLQVLGGNITTHANDTLNEAKKAESTYSSTVNGIVKASVSNFSGNILGYIDITTNWAIDAVENDLGPCRILSDVYDGVVNLICRDTVYPFNGYWFSIGFSLFFYIPAIILAVKLAKHYRRMRFEEGFDRHDGNVVEMHERNKPWLNQGNTVYPR